MLNATLSLPDASAVTDATVPAADHGALSDPLAALARRAARGDVQAFEALYRAEHRRIHAAVWRLVGGHEARAEELTQDAFVRAWRSLPGFRFEAPVGAWLHRLAVNTALMDLRARRDAGASASDRRPARPQ